MKYTAWLKQFSEKDRKYAEKLVSSLIYIKKEQFDSSFNTLFHTTINPTEVHAFFIVREAPYDKKTNVYTKDFWETPDSKPSIYENPEDIGSEGDMAHLLRDLKKSNTNYIIHPSIEEMRAKKCRHLVFVNDIAGSGTQTWLFINWILQNPTIKSWISFHNIRDIILLHYATTYNAEKVFSLNKLIKSYSACCINQGSPDWTFEEEKIIRSICKRYGKKANIKKQWYFGYDNSFLLYLFSTGAPNNLPGILWKKTDNWEPLIDRKRPDFNEETIYQLSIIDKIKNKYEQLFSSKKHIIKITEKNELLVLILLQLQKEKYNQKKLSYVFNTSIFIINESIEKLKKMDLLDLNFKVTKKGKKVIKYLKKEKK